MMPTMAISKCADVERPARRRQPQREGDEHLAEAKRQSLPPLEMRELLFVQSAAEVLVGVGCVVREEPLEVLA